MEYYFHQIFVLNMEYYFSDILLLFLTHGGYPPCFGFPAPPKTDTLPAAVLTPGSLLYIPVSWDFYGFSRYGISIEAFPLVPCQMPVAVGDKNIKDLRLLYLRLIHIHLADMGRFRQVIHIFLFFSTAFFLPPFGFHLFHI